MVEKRFELVGISEMSIMYQGLIYPPKKRVVLRVCESDKDFYSQFMAVESVKELSKNKIDYEPVAVSEKDTITVETATLPEMEIVEKPKPKPKTTTQPKKTITKKKTTTNKTKK